tara:strand:- start:715 stop:1218 length:504 start_codon:yes stop_codon:yes gene_type:complete
MQTTLFSSIRANTVLLLSSMLLFTVGCEEEHGDDHLEAHGFILENAGEEVYRQLEGEVSGSVPSISVGETLELTVHFLDHDGDEVEHDEDHDEDEGSLSITVADASIATVTPEEHDDADADEHEMALEIVGIAEGSTSFTLALMHGEDHADYTATNSVAITVTAAGN